MKIKIFILASRENDIFIIQITLRESNQKCIGGLFTYFWRPFFNLLHLNISEGMF